MNHVIEHCGNFSSEVLEGMIGYGRETNRGRGKMGGKNQLPAGDGYPTREADILLGGFIQRHAAQGAAYEGESLAEMNVQEMERLAFRVAREHLERHGPSGSEHYGHWMVRARGFAKRHHTELPSQGNGETDHEYFRRVRKWVKERPEQWPDLNQAAGTHLVLSPDPKVWQAIRSMGLDERLFLKTVTIQTMKDFSDWRRKQVGPGHSLGWVAGTHVRDNGADRHPHVHLVVLKRDEAGKAVDWSVSCLKGRRGKTDPDPMRELKRLFGKNVEKHLERMVGKENVPAQEHNPVQEITRLPEIHIRRSNPSIYSLAHGIRAIEAVMCISKSPHPPDPFEQAARDIGTLIRFVAVVMDRIEEAKEARKMREWERDVSRGNSNAKIIREYLERQGERDAPPRRPSRGADMEMEM